MLSWIWENRGTLVTGLLVAAAVFFVIRKLYKDKKAGKGGCGCGCGDCPFAGSCHKEK